MKHSIDSRVWLVVLALIMTMTLVACVRPLQDKEEVPATATPGQTSPDLPPGGVPTIAPEDVAPPGDGTDSGQTPPDSGQLPVDTGEGSGTAQPIDYQVQEGDTLEIVAGRYNVTVESLATANGLTVDAVLLPGQILVIPLGEGVAEQPVEPTVPTEPEQPAEQPATEPVVPTEPAVPAGDGSTHVVQSGEWLYSIGRLYGCSGLEMIQANPQFPNPDRLSPGDIVNVPPNCGG